MERLFKRGTSHSTDPKETKRVQLVNTVCLFGLLFCFLFLITNLFQGLYKPIIGLIAGIVLCGYIYSLNGKPSMGKQKVARILLLVSAYSFYFANANFLFIGKLAEFFYIFIVILSMLLLDSLIFQIAVLVVCILSFYLPNYFFHYYDSNVFGYANIAVLFVTVFWLIRQFIDLNEQNERRLLKDKNTILAQKQQIEEFNRLRSQFFTDLSHEIRTPLTLLQGYSESLVKSPGISSPEQQRKFQIIKEQVENINNLLSNILGLSKMEDQAFGLNTKLVELYTFLDAIKSKFTFLFEKKGIAFYVSSGTGDIMIDIDTQLFEHALSNLLSNALKYTPKKGEVSISTKIDLQQLQITVTDNGKGIPKKYLTKIFDRYFQIDESSITEGMGIGLSYTKRIIDAHGFKITAASKPNIYTRFSISIPIENIIIENTESKLKEDFIVNCEGKVHVPFQTKGNLPTNRHKILIVEDNQQMQEFLVSILNGHDLTLTKHGKEALSFLAQDIFEVLITDYTMPVMDGERLVQKVKSLNLQIPILVLTARSDDQTKRQMLRLGVDAYITKPFIKEELVHHVEKSIALMGTINKHQSNLGGQERKFINEHAAMFNQELNDFIHNNMRSHHFSVENIAEHFNISKSTLNRRVKSLLGQTTKQIIMETRLQKARELFLTMPMAKHKEIAEAVGIKNSTYLQEQLEKRFGGK